MTELAVLDRLLDDSDFPVEQLTCHPRLPLAAGTSTDCRTVRVFDCAEGRLRELAALDAEPGASPWGDSAPQAVAWHPHRPLLLVADGEFLLRWTADDPSGPVRVPAGAEYDALAFSPDGGRLWATPSADDGWTGSDVLDPATGAVTGTARHWDTGVAVHPSGELVATLASDQGATYCLFARPGDGPAAAMRTLRQALILDCDGYGAPLFSADGRHFAIRGNAYVDMLEVFAFPSLRKVLSTTLAEDSSEEWPRGNLAWSARPGVLWIGTPTGSLLELDVEAREAAEHASPDDVPVAALAATANGDLLLARTDGELVLLSVRPASAAAEPNDDVAVFLAGTEEAPLDGAVDEHLEVTDGIRSWTDDDLDSVTETSDDDPTWLQIQASMNRFRSTRAT
ncbi:YncE family protein [Kitasatospora sp. NPDC048407]|uniref:YncE family protein n=1 Tax=Kitasatospora sp. NPDC048407 TaxID=3364051 RepID=UPI003718D883